MARIRRPLSANLTHHVTAKAIPPQICFVDNDSRGTFRQLLASLANQVRVEIHAYAMMDNHLHLMLTAREQNALAVAMRILLGRHTMLLNRAKGRQGPLWHDRYATVPVESDDHAINTHLYIDANPWRARVVEHPRESDWTSYLALAEGLGSAFLTPHPVIAQLGKDSSERQAVYRRIMERYIKESPRFKMNGNGRQAADPLAGLRLSQYTEA